MHTHNDIVIGKHIYIVKIQRQKELVSSTTLITFAKTLLHGADPSVVGVEKSISFNGLHI